MRKKYPSSTRKSPPRRRLSDQFQGGEILLMFIITLVFLFLSIFTLFYHNKNATNGYKLKTLREERETLIFDIEILDRQIADVSAINTNSSENSDNENLSHSRGNKYRTKIIYLKGVNKNEKK